MKKLSPLVLMSFLAACGGHSSAPIPPAKDIPVTPKGDVQGNVDEVPNWFTKSPEQDQAEGTQADRAYKELGLRTGVEPVIVAVIDSGIDVTHEDLQGHLWTNPGEIPDNGVDDDRNGFVDDIHGWNFLGSVKDGKNVSIGAAPLEVTREVVRLTKLKAEREAQGGKLTTEEAALFDKVTKEVNESRESAQAVLDQNLAIEQRVIADYPKLKDALGIEIDAVTLVALKALKSEDVEVLKTRDALVEYLAKEKFTTMTRVEARIDSRKEQLEFHFNVNFDPRKEIIGDDPANFVDHAYGNNDISAEGPDHGTHVAGIIGAVRGNNLGIDGVAQDVRIMGVRAVPNGDEYDKDIANAVRYAVANKARVINMSFGKDYSPFKAELDKAFEEAARAGVLIVHSAGNSSQNTDIDQSFPNPNTLVTHGLIPGWISVGASARRLDLNLAASFSNYGPKTVEIFAPGVDILSTVPYETDQGKYDSYSGTSMAAPTLVGVAALVLSQKPELNAVELRQLLIDTARKHTEHVVKLPLAIEGPLPNLTYFGALSQSGGIVDAYAALKKALAL